VSGRRSRLRIQVLSGSFRGESFEFEHDRIVVGRGGDCILRFDPASDLSVSSRHARLVRGSEGWIVEDLASTNGTYVNGKPAVGPTRLREGDLVQFGRGGPEVRVSLSYANSRGGSPGAADATRTSSGSGKRGRLRWLVTAVLAVVAVTALGAIWVGRTNRRSWQGEREVLMRRVDSLLSAQAALDSERRSALAQLSDSLVIAREEVRRLRESLSNATSTNDRDQIEELQRRLQEAVTLLERQQLAATLDFEGIRRQVEPAVAMIWSELSDGTVLTGTAVSIDRYGTLLTNRHVIAPEGRTSNRLAVQFAGSNQVWRASLIEAHQSADLAWARTEGIVGDVPHVDRFNERPDTLPLGSAVALVGFPLGGGPVAESTGRRRAIVSAGVLLDRRPDELRIQGYGAPGASGSPVVDRDGRIVGLIYGAETGSSILLAVPIGLAGEDR
jgi:S1-C subfamily serine protease